MRIRWRTSQHFLESWQSSNGKTVSKPLRRLYSKRQTIECFNRTSLTLFLSPSKRTTDTGSTSQSKLTSTKRCTFICNCSKRGTQNNSSRRKDRHKRALFNRKRSWNCGKWSWTHFLILYSEKYGFELFEADGDIYNVTSFLDSWFSIYFFFLKYYLVRLDLFIKTTHRYDLNLYYK